MRRFPPSPIEYLSILRKSSTVPSSNPAPTSYYTLRYKSKTEERETKMNKIVQLCVITLVAASAIFEATNPMVGGPEIFP